MFIIQSINDSSYIPKPVSIILINVALSPDHRSVALSNQASIIFVLLNFCPKILQSENAKMREIVDKHFPDNWVVPIYQGHLIDLTEIWAPSGSS